jgi:hypothetical protein
MRVISPPVTNGFNIQSHQAPRQRKLPANDQSEITKCEKSEQHVGFVFWKDAYLQRVVSDYNVKRYNAQF